MLAGISLVFFSCCVRCFSCGLILHIIKISCYTSAVTLTITLFFPQTCIAKHESNGIDIIIALIVNPINPLGKHRLDLVLELKVSSRCLGPALEGHPLRLTAIVTATTILILTICFKVVLTHSSGCWEQDNWRQFYHISKVWKTNLAKNVMFYGINGAIFLLGDNIGPLFFHVLASVCWLQSSPADQNVKAYWWSLVL